VIADEVKNKDEKGANIGYDANTGDTSICSRPASSTRRA